MSRKRKNVDTAKRGKFTELLEQLAVSIAEGYVEEFKLDPALARQLADLAMGIIQDNAGGGGIYVGKGHLWAVTQLHWRIYSRFTGDNHFALAQEFDKSERQIYTIVERCREIEFKRRQPDLFEQTG
jgi:Mor family transcriptional regulator